jgi:MFS family permease
MATDTPMSVCNDAAPAYSQGSYRHYVLLLLVLMYALTTVDRGIIMALIEPIKRELGLSDTDAAILVGPAFAVFFVAAGIPLGRLADRGSRRLIIAACVFGWSLMTAFCGLAHNFAQLFIGRVGVGIGEAGGPPAAVAMISDIYSPQRRATASSFFYGGSSLGVMIAFGGGAWIASHYGWRAAFLAAAAPGILLAGLVALTVREPPRGLSEGHRELESHEPLARVLRFMLSQRSLLHLLAGAVLAQTVGTGAMTFFVSYIVRSHGLPLSEAGLIVSLCFGLGSGAGVVTFGWLADTLARHDLRWRCRLPAITLIISLIALAATALATTASMLLAMLFLWSFCCTGYTATSYAAFQSLVKVDMRATMGSMQFIMLAVVAGILGPMLVGAGSDLLTPRFGVEALRYAILAVALLYVWAAVHFLLAQSRLAADLRRTRGGPLLP